MRREMNGPPPSISNLPSRVGAADAERVLGISRTTLHVLANSGRLPGRMIDKRGEGRRWQFKLSDVVRLRDSRKVVKYHKSHRIRKREIWEAYFGSIPAGYTVACRDRDENNIGVDNLCLLPLKSKRKLDHQIYKSSAPKRGRNLWSRDQLAYLRKTFATHSTRQIAEELQKSEQSVRGRARALRLRKSISLIRAQARQSHRLPVGTERVKHHTGIVWVKVSLEGRQYNQWRPKHHVIWEQATGQSVPPTHVLLFRDGDKRNYDVTNLELIPRLEMSARGLSRFLSYPPELQKAIKLTSKLRRESRGSSEDHSTKRGSPKSRRMKHSPATRWTEQMDAYLVRSYPLTPITEIIETLRVSESSLRNRAKRLGIRRTPEVMIAQARAAAASM